MDFLVEFEVTVPKGTPESEVAAREDAESAAAAKLVDEGHLIRLWKRHVASGESRPIGLYRAESEADMDGLLRALPLYEWMRVTVTPLESHPNDPAVQQRVPRHRQEAGVSSHLPEPRLTQVYRLEATLAPPLELGETAQGHRRIVPLTGGTFSGPELSGRLVPGASADWQIILPDGTALGDIRYVLETDR
ncbi:MAG TPA: muconolactone Delta-isomerase family protein, partial [Solirubrobacteraceae bacterium]